VRAEAVRPAAGLVAAVAAVLLVGGCGSGGSSGSGDEARAAATATTAGTIGGAGGAGTGGTAAPTGQPGPGGPGSPSGEVTVTASPAAPAAKGPPSVDPSASDLGGASTDSTESVEGVWLATADGAKVQLVLGKGKASLTSSHLCGGVYKGTGIGDDNLRLTLTCMDGDKERAKGTGRLSSDGRSLTVEWDAGPTDAFSRTGLPSS